MSDEVTSQRQRRQAVSFPVVHPPASVKQKEAFYVQQYTFLANFVHQQKPDFGVEVIFVFPRDEVAYRVMSERHKVKLGLHDSLKLLVYPFWPSKKLTPRNFLKALPKLQLVQIEPSKFKNEDDFQDLFDGVSPVSGSIYQLSTERRYDFEVMREFSQVKAQVAAKLSGQSAPFVVKSGEVHPVSLLFFAGNYWEAEELLARARRIVAK